MEHPTHSSTAVLDAAVHAGVRPAVPATDPLDDPPPGDRIRAARAAADLNRDELARCIGSSARTIRRLEDGKRRATDDELQRIAAACRAPEWFLAHGWRGWERSAAER